nr:ABC transporter permease subunit [uncultured Acetatifactor sp.]
MNASVQGKKKNTVLHRMKKYRILYLLAIIPFAYLIVFRYWPIFLQFVLATKNYTIKGGIWGSPFIGLDNFAQLFQSQEFQKILFNTIRISLLRLLCGFVPPIILSIMLFDMTSKKFRRISQSILYIPHFFSWVIVYAIVQVLFQNTGYINSFLGFIGVEAKQFLMSERYFLPILIGSGLWKSLGWSTIIYLAALTNINTELFEAARLDGAGPIQRIRYITLPGIVPIIVFSLMINLGSILSAAGTEQILLFYSPTNYEVSDVIGTWLYRQGLGKLKYGLGAAVSVFESSVGLVLVLVSNKLANKFAGLGIW